MKNYLKGLSSFFIILTFATLLLSSCEEKTPREKAAEDIEKAAESVGDVFKSEGKKLKEGVKDIGKDIKETTKDIVKKDQ